MSSPGKRTSKASKNVVPLDPRSVGNGSRLLLKEGSLETRVSTDSQKDHGDGSQQTRRHLGHERSQNLGRRVFSLPVSVFGVEGEGGNFSTLGSKGRSSNRGALGSDKGRSGGKDQGAYNKAKFGHFDLFCEMRLSKRGRKGRCANVVRTGI